jgi:hypothetical protein
VSSRYDGTDRRAHIQVKGQGIFFAEEPVAADDVQPSPDGQWVLAHISNQLYLIAMPLVGGEAPTVTEARDESTLQFRILSERAPRPTAAG